jgi:hypothetical protein
MSTAQELSVTAALDQGRAIATLTTAFSNDPIARWVLRDADTYLNFWPRLVQVFADSAFDHGTADSVANHGGVALWLGPGVGPDEEAMGALVGDAVAPGEQDDVFGFMAQMDEFHPTYPHWYLPLIGVDLPHHGRGYGSVLLSTHCAGATTTNCPPISRRPTHETSASTNGMDSRSWASFRSVGRRRCGRCCINRP